MARHASACRGALLLLLPSLLAVAVAVAAAANLTATPASAAAAAAAAAPAKPLTAATTPKTTPTPKASPPARPAAANTVGNTGPFSAEALEMAEQFAAAGGDHPMVGVANSVASLFQSSVLESLVCGGGSCRGSTLSVCRKNQTAKAAATTTTKAVGDPASTAVPVIAIPAECVPCDDLAYPSPAVFSTLCALCLTALPALPSWPDQAQFGTVDPILNVNTPLARMPLSEAGYVALPSIPLLYPRRYVSFDLRALGATPYTLQATDQSYTNDAWGGGLRDPTATWTIGGRTLRVASTTHARVPQTCVLEPGWVTPPGLGPCPGAPDFDWTQSDVSFPSLAAASEAIPLPYSNAEDYRRVAAAQIADAFASPEGAARAIFDSTQTAYATVVFQKNVTRASAPDRLAELQALYGDDEWQEAWTAMANRGDLVEIDLTYTQGMESTVPGGPWWNVAAHGLFEARTTTGKECDKRLFAADAIKAAKHASNKDCDAKTTSNDGKASHAAPSTYDDASGAKKDAGAGKHHGKGSGVCTVLRPVAIRLSNQPVGDADAAFVYTPQKSASAYVLAALAMRMSITQTAIWVGHVFNLHIMNVAATLALYNTVDPTDAPYFATSPLRQTLDWFVDPTYVSEFHTFLFDGGYLAGPGTAVGVPDLLKLWELWAAKEGANWATSKVGAQLAASGLSESRFRGAGLPGSWDGLPGPAYALKLRKLATPYATTLINAAYADDAAVASDASIQALSATLCAADGSNLVALRVPTDGDDGCALDTRERLARFVGDWMSLVTTHSSAHLQDFVMRIQNMPLAPPRLGKQVAPDPDGVFTESDFLEWVPSTATMARQVAFFAEFIATSWTYAITNQVPSQQWQKGDVPVWKDDLPIVTGVDDPARVGAAHVAFIGAVSALYENVPRSGGFRDTVTNYQQPTRAPRIINI